MIYTIQISKQQFDLIQKCIRNQTQSTSYNFNEDDIEELDTIDSMISSVIEDQSENPEPTIYGFCL